MKEEGGSELNKVGVALGQKPLCSDLVKAEGQMSYWDHEEI